MKNALIIFKKEIKEVIKNKNIWFPILIVTIMFSIIMPSALLISGEAMAGDLENNNFIDRFFFDFEDPYEALIHFMTKQFLIFLLLIPAMVPSLIAPASIIMEKESKSLEPLLATPVKTSELLLGKTLTSMIPSFAISTISFIILVINIDIISYIKAAIIPLPTLEWVVAALILSPVISFIITMISLIISSKSTDIRAAQGIGSVVIFPIYAIIGLQIAGFFLLNIWYLLTGCFVLIMVCPFVLKLGVKLFDRENILTRWKMR